MGMLGRALGRDRDRPQLVVEHPGVAPRRAVAAHAERRVRLILGGQERQGLVAAGVERAQHDGAPREGREHLGVGLDLLVHGRRARAIEEAELGAEQAHTLRTPLERARRIARCPDVGGELHEVAVARAARSDERRHREHARRGGLHSGVGLHDELARAAVDEHERAVGEPRRPHRPHDRGNAELARDDRRVRGRPALLCHEREARGRVERDRVGGRQIVGDDDDRMPRLGQPRQLHSAQARDDAVAHIDEVDRALGEPPARLAVALRRARELAPHHGFGREAV
ncbi:MAG: hypothetical protein RIC81_00135, partial [Microcella pacifica]